jgi:hypothetical protein
MPRDKSTRGLTPEEAIQYMQDTHGIRRSLNTLKTYVTRGTGPAFIKVGGARRYFPKDIDAYIQRITSPRKWSTSKLVDQSAGRRRPTTTAARA